MKTRFFLSGMTMLLLLMGIVSIASAVPVVSYSNTFDSGTNLWTYESTITNDTPDILYDFVIYPTVKPLSGSDMTAVGWGLADAGGIAPDYFVHWMADFGSEIGPDGTMGGFWFTYSGVDQGSIGPLSYTVSLWDIANDAPVDPPFDGSTVPLSTQVPEPGTLMLLVMGFAGVGVLWGRKIKT